MYCSNCGKELKEGAKFCGNCGNEVNIERDIKSDSKDFEEEKKETNGIIRKILKQTIIIVLSFIVLMSIMSCIVFLIRNIKVNKRQNTNETIVEEKEITIPLGVEAKGIAKILKENNIISKEQDFIEYIELNNIENFQAGTYYMKENMDLEKIVDMLQSGRMYMSDIEIEPSKIGKTVEDLDKEIRMYEWEDLYPTKEEQKELSGAEWDLKYEYILYDSKGRELVNIPGEKRTENYYKYTEIDEYSYYQSRLYLNPFLEEMYHEELCRIYLNEKFDVINEEIVYDVAKTREEYVILLEEHNGYIEYIDKHKSYRNNLDEYRRMFEE